ncbi:MAG: 5'-nucleotidase C-terminal domain-containing protein [Ignavibacteria bacterium]|nr:5'-nucleotidase C-terminal domain-containing protein [Ignavibacteria bacterium]
MKMLVLFFVACLSTSVTFADTLTIVHVNDTHSNLASGGTRDSKLQGTIGGIARAASYIGNAKASMPNVLTLHAGDIYVGDLFFQKYYGVAELQLMGMIGFDAMTVGNHEFDLTPATLQTALDTAFTAGQPFPLLSANLVLENDTVKGLKKYIQPSTIKMIGSIKVGIFGLTTPETNLLSLPAPASIDTAIVQIANSTVKYLQDQDCDVIILLSHLGVAGDQSIAKSVSGMHLIVGGHDHYVLDKPMIINGTPIVQAGAFYHEIGLVQLEVTNGAVKLLNAHVSTLDQSIPEEPTVAAVVAGLIADIESVYGKVYSEKIAEADHDIHEVAEELTQNGNKDTELGNLVTDAYRAFAQTDIAVQPGGSMAQILYKGELVAADAFRAVGYGFNTLNGLGFRMATFSVMGAELMAGLEFGLSNIELNDEFLIQVSGMKYSYNPLANVGERLLNVEVGGNQINPAATYSIASNEFVLAFFGLIGIQPTNIKILGDTTEFAVLAGYLQAIQKATPSTLGRIKAERISAVKENAEYKHQVIVSPNPAITQTSVQFTTTKTEKVRLVLYSSIMKEVAVPFDGEVESGNQTIRIDTTYLPTGAYLYKLTIGGSSIVGQIIVHK